MILPGRVCPELSLKVLFSDREIEVFTAYAKKKPWRTRPGDLVRLVVCIGGYIGRAKDPLPGDELMWQDDAQLQMMCDGSPSGG